MFLYIHIRPPVSAPTYLFRQPQVWPGQAAVLVKSTSITTRMTVPVKTILITIWVVPQPHLSCSVSDGRNVQAVPERSAVVAEVQQAHGDCTRGLSRKGIPQALQLLRVCALALQEAAVPAQHLVPAGAARYRVCM